MVHVRTEVCEGGHTGAGGDGGCGTGEPALSVFGNDFTEGAEGTSGDEVFGVFEHGVARVGMGNGEEEVFFLGEGIESFGIREGESERFITDNMEIVVEEDLDWLKMKCIWSNNTNKMNTLVFW